MTTQNNIIEEILTLVHWGESDDLELKSARGGLPGSLWETYSAMANTQGGTIILGIEDNGVVSGISNVSTLKKSFWNGINNRNKVSANLLNSNDVAEIPHENGTILAIHVPKASRSQRPVFVGQNPLTGTYRRNHEGDYQKDRATGQEGLTVAGLLMFGKDEALREALPSYNVDYREKLSDDPSVRWTDRLMMDGTWSGNLFQFYFRVIGRLEADLKLPFQLNSDLFRKGDTVVHESIREALVNALIHADYQGMGGVVVEKYPNRFEFSNPGSLLISFDQLWRGGISECRNKALQNMFTQIGAAEKAGSGVDKIFRGWSSQHWRLPIVREQVQPDRVHWILTMISLIPQESLDRLERYFKGKFSKFTENEVQALVTADLEKYVDNARMRQITGGHATDMTKLLQSLVSEEALVAEGQGRWTRYCLPDSLDSLHNDSYTTHNDSYTTHNDSYTTHNDSYTTHNDSHTTHSKELSPDTQKTLNQIAEPAQKNPRLPPQEMEQIILKLCQDKWLTRKQLGELVDRNPEGLRSRFLTPMVEHGLLRLRYPDKPRRVDQSYTAANKTN